jgi:protein-tyrosine-phosphatase/DNA-binding HxlR family transcriptional regulator
MSIERNIDLRRRAELHAVLADEGRLAIVDTLLLSDASPSELAELTGMPSNLLAHHLRVLEASGVIRRRRSDGDRRRAYVQLVGDQLQDLKISPKATRGRIVFVCTANSARSQLAAALWQRVSDVPAVSAGTHPADRVAPRTVTVAKRHRLRLQRRRPADLATARQAGDVIVCVCDQAYEELRRSTSRDELHWSIPDPVPLDTDEAFEAAFTDIEARVERLAAAVPVA